MCALFGWLDYKGLCRTGLLKKLTGVVNRRTRNGCVWHCLCESSKVTIYGEPKPATRFLCF